MHIIACESIFWYNEKGTGVKIQMKKMGAFHTHAKFGPLPASAYPVIFDSKPGIAKCGFEAVFKCG